jgi:tRNA nucleotidyltransferase (CCA-adding enzyme)
MDLREMLSPVAPILAQLEDAGFEAYAVGGCVRDALRGVPPHDFDLTTSATPSEMLTVFANRRVHKTGLQHGTLTVMLDKEPIEITTYRTDGAYTDARHPTSVTFTASLKEDLARRDFTVNAIAADRFGNIIDPFHGISDLQNKTLRCVGDAQARFSEDALRILRLFRFCAVLGFLPDKDALDAVTACSPLLQKIAVERIYSEIKSALCGAFLDLALPFAAPIFAQIAPDFENTAFSSAAPLLAAFPPDFVPRFFALCLHFGCAPAPILQRLRADNETKGRITRLCTAWDQFAIDSPKHARMARAATLGRQDCLTLLRLRALLRNESTEAQRNEVNEWYDSHACLTISDMAISGRDLIALGFAQGETLGQTLSQLLTAIQDDLVKNERDSLLQYLKKM